MLILTLFDFGIRSLDIGIPRTFLSRLDHPSGAGMFIQSDLGW